MTEESKSEETLRIEISHFASPNKQSIKRNSRADLKEENLNDNSMKISIERKSSKKSININVNEMPTSERSGNTEGIQIKIEKRDSKKDLKEGMGSPSKSKRESVSRSPNKSPKKKRQEENSINVEPLPNANSTSTTRVDAYGNQIKKGSNKKQKVTFIDTIPRNKQNLIKYIDVECYKAYNVDVSQGTIMSKIKGNNCCGNGCSIY